MIATKLKTTSQRVLMQGSGWDRLGLYATATGAASASAAEEDDLVLDGDGAAQGLFATSSLVAPQPSGALPPDFVGFNSVPPRYPGVVRELTQGIGEALDRMSTNVYAAEPFMWADRSFTSGYIYGREKMPPRMWRRFEGLAEPDVPVWVAMHLAGRGAAIVFSPRFAFLWHEWRQNIQTFGMVAPKPAVGFIV